ncbi:MAG: adenylosuccinate lyase [Elusimicrobia bacterium]|nr:adenylosuccinate lyase [Elusimicrobiota bacterium]
MAVIDRYSRPEMREVWSDENRFAAMLEVEAAFLEVLAKEKRIPSCEIRLFRKAIKRRLVAKTREIEGSTGHEVISLLTAALDEISFEAPGLARYLHYGLTSSDLLDTALAMQLVKSADLLLRDWEAVAGRIKGLSKKHQNAWMAGRTHGVHAEPITFGFKLAGWFAEARRNIERLGRARHEIAYGKLSGAVGTFAHYDPSVEAKALSRLGLRPEPAATQVVPRDRHADFFHAVVLSAAAIERFATEIRHLQRTEVGEAAEPFGSGQKGSSAMPHKRNPVLCENLCGLSRLIRSYEGAVVENIVLWHERDISHSSVERVVLPDAVILLDFMLGRFKGVLDGLDVFPDRMESNLRASQGQVFSQKVMLKLIDAGMGRWQAYDAVQRAALSSRAGKPFLEELSSDGEVVKRLSKKELSACFATASYGKHLPAIMRRAGIT